MRYLMIMITILVTGCNRAGYNSAPKYDDENRQVQQDQYSNLSQGSVKYVRKAELAQWNCDVQSKRHNEQRLLAEFAPPIVIQDGVAVNMENYPTTKFYNQDVKPFDMAGCIVKSMQTGTERILSQFMDGAFNLGESAIKQSPYYYLYKAGKNSAASITSSGDVVYNEGNGSATYSPDNSDNRDQSTSDSSDNSVSSSNTESGNGDLIDSPEVGTETEETPEEETPEETPDPETEVTE